jgi:hypothetical protein
MADPRAQMGLGDMAAIAALCAAAEKNSSPGQLFVAVVVFLAIMLMGQRLSPHS